MELKILQWNVWFREQADAIVSVLRAVDADILCLQELTTDSFVNPGVDVGARIEALGYHRFYHQTLERVGKNYYTMGIAIFSRVPMVSNAGYCGDCGRYHPHRCV